jgi:hypothetical protein
VIQIAHRRCKGIAHVFRRFTKDPVILGVIMRVFLNDQPGGFSDVLNRLPVRFFVAPFDLLADSEKLVVWSRAACFLTYYLRIALNPTPLRDSPVTDLMKVPVTPLSVDGIMKLNIPGFVPDSELTRNLLVNFCLFAF